MFASAHYSIAVVNHEAGQRLKIALVDQLFRNAALPGAGKRAVGAETTHGQQE
jgi:hypothetical protein